MIVSDKTTSGAQILQNNPTLFSDIIRFWKKMTAPVLLTVANTILQTASKFSPPGRNHKLGFATIPEEMYYCQIINIDSIVKLLNRRKQWQTGPAEEDDLRPIFTGKFYKQQWVKGDKASGVKGHYEVDKTELNKIEQPIQNLNGAKELKIYKEDWKAWKNGMRFKIVSNKEGAPRKTLGYARTMPEAKKMARIINRGLAKYSWGTLLGSYSQLHSVDGQLIVEHSFMDNSTFKTLARKSPNITRYTWGEAHFNDVDMKNLNWSLLGYTTMNTDQAYTRLALKKGAVEGTKKFKHMMNALARNNTKSILRLMGNTLRTIINKYE